MQHEGGFKGCQIHVHFYGWGFCNWQHELDQDQCICAWKWKRIPIMFILENVTINTTTTNFTQVLLCVMLNFKGINEEVMGRKLMSFGLMDILCLLMCTMASPLKSNMMWFHFLHLSIMLHI
jgi:hypothetical protein